jgi:hypothetical protein
MNAVKTCQFMKKDNIEKKNLSIPIEACCQVTIYSTTNSDATDVRFQITVIKVYSDQTSFFTLNLNLNSI